MTSTTITLNADGTFSDTEGNVLTLRSVIDSARERRDAHRVVVAEKRAEQKKERAAAKKARLEERKAKLEAKLAALDA